MKKILEVKDLSVSFETYGAEVQAVRGVSFELNERETLAIVGESGSGKSVTASSIMRLIPMPPGKFVGGSILFNGEDLTTKIRKTDAKYSRERNQYDFSRPDDLHKPDDEGG